MKKLYISMGIIFCSGMHANNKRMHANSIQWANRNNYKKTMQKLFKVCIEHEERLKQSMPDDQAAIATYNTNATKEILKLRDLNKPYFQALLENTL